jgi:dTDP-4-amino-4,6-dideoxy-D-galactose acyltransferase
MIMSKKSSTLECLRWDSEFFNKNVCRLNIAKDTSLNEVRKLMKAASAEDIDVVYIICSAPQHAAFIRAALKNATVTENVTFSKYITIENVLPLNSSVFSYDGEETPELTELALLSGKHSRFFVDERFRPDFERLYYAWLKNSLNKSIADRVFTVSSGKASMVLLPVEPTTNSVL